jgi:hypothetical protein
MRAKALLALIVVTLAGLTLMLEAGRTDVKAAHDRDRVFEWL